LFGRNGAAYVYRVKGRQKQIQLLDMGLRHFNDQVQKPQQKVETMVTLLAAWSEGEFVFWMPKIKSGIDFVMEQTGFDTLLKQYRLSYYWRRFC
jgi:glycerate kinase